MNQPSNLGIKDIAKLANVSIGTVDRVLHNRKGVSQATREKVLKIIRQTGYQKNVVASRLKLAAHKKIKIAVMFPEITVEWSYWKLPKMGMMKAVHELEELGISIDFFYFNINKPQTFKKHWEYIKSNTYHGLVTVPFLERACNSLLKDSHQLSIPVVFLDTERKLSVHAHFIRQNSFKAGGVAARLLYNQLGEQGTYVVVHLAKEGEIQINSLQREEGFRVFFKDNFPHQSFKLNTIIHFEEEVASIEAKLQFFEGKPLGVFVSNARAFLLADTVHAQRKAHTQIVGFDLNEKNIDCLERETIQYLINQKPEYQGYTAIKGLYKYLTQNDASELNADIPVEIIIKENVAFYTAS